ncbi:acyl-CoA dehydrogenase family protein [Peribacillus butanolivorans]|uniref:acyl-CoA dehydrogenase family protein n=1 Tax=Peribacillus butanolivorans TaxID=421767 RepID=UPI0036A16283
MIDLSQIIEDTTRKLLKDLCTKDLIDDSEEGEFPIKLWKTLNQTGMTTIGISEESGGSGGSLTDAFNFLRIAGNFSAPVPIAETFMSNWILSKVGLPISNKPMTLVLSSKDQKISFTEKSNGYIVCGSANSIPWARAAQTIVVLGDSDEGKMVVIVDQDACQIEPGKNLAGESRDHLDFKNVFVENKSVSRFVDIDEDKLWYLGALVRSVQMTGALERVLELSAAYSTEREQFGRQIAKFQAVQQQIAILAGEVSAAKAVTDLAIKAFIAGDGEKQIMIAKIRVGDAVSLGVPIAHQIHGAMGFTDEHSLQHSTRRLWSWRDEFGNEDFWSQKLGGEVLSSGADNLWALITSMNSKIV